MNLLPVFIFQRIKLFLQNVKPFAGWSDKSFPPEHDADALDEVGGHDLFQPQMNMDKHGWQTPRKSKMDSERGVCNPQVDSVSKPLSRMI